MDENPKILKVFAVCLGCPKNRVDIEVALSSIDKLQPIKLVPNPKEANFIIVNTCSFIEPATKESIETILELAENLSDNQKLIVMGCLPQRYKEELIKELPEVDFFFGTEAPWLIGKKLLGSPDSRNLMEPKRTIPCFHTRYQILPSSYLKISEGCSNKCSFCLIPQIRGPLRNRSPEDILKEAQWLEEQGVKELILIAQDLTAYKKQGVDLVDLLELLIRESSIKWIRLMYLNPKGVSKRLLETIAKHDRILNYLDIPIQHVSSKILKTMRRGYDKKFLIKLFQKIRDIIPNIAIRTTVMVGFPGETEEDFNELVNFVKKQRFLNLGCFTYVDEEQSLSFKLKNKVNSELAQKRKDIIMKIQSQIAKELNSKYIGRKVPAIIEGYSNETNLLLQARTYFQAPEIDGITYISKGNAKVGEIKTVEITDSHIYDLVGHILEQQ